MPRSTFFLLLLFQAASSTMADIEAGTHFKPVLADPLINKTKVKRVVMLSGKVYYELIKEHQARGLNDAVAFVCIKELTPCPFEHLEEVLYEYFNAEEFVWLQEEPKNQGAFSHFGGRITSVLWTPECGHSVG